MDLSLELAPLRTRGRAPIEITIEETRPLRRDDLVLLQEEKGSKTTPLKRLSERHHSLAKAIASGMKPGEAGIVFGYSASRVSILQADPSFKELVKFYSEQKDAQYVEMHERLAGLSVDALEELRQRLEDDPEQFSNGLLLDLVTKLADRTGHGPSSSSTQVNVNVNLAGRLQAARERVAKAREINGTARAKEDGTD